MSNGTTNRTRTVDWQYFDETAIQIAKSLVAAQPHSNPSAIAETAYKVADAMARESYRRRVREADYLYEFPHDWIAAECGKERPNSNKLKLAAREFLLNFVEAGRLDPSTTFPDAIKALGDLAFAELNKFADENKYGHDASNIRYEAIQLLRDQI
ncbi:hypothetical protein AB7849_15455 [Rhodanobacter sp. 115]|uniref:hypothetical protein n=1 Tax=Rhodanobacter sp. FW021-MT20 TaxID=1162282 RepID=UPI0034E3B969